MSKRGLALVIALLFAAFALVIVMNPDSYAYCSFHKMIWHTAEKCWRYGR